MTSKQLDGVDTVMGLIRGEQLAPRFQPIAALADGAILGHEALIRGPSGSPLEFPDALFGRSREESVTFELEQHCVKTILRRAESFDQCGKVFVNLSAHALTRLADEAGVERLSYWAASHGFPLRKLVIEITEHESVTDTGDLIAKANAMRAVGIVFAIDDFGEGRSSLRLWAELEPEFVKIDKFFTRGLGEHAYKIQTLKTIVHMAETLGGQLIAEGIETAHTLALVRDLGIEFGQGYFLGRPAHEPLRKIEAAALEEIGRREVPVLQNARVVRNQSVSAEKLIIRVPPMSSAATNEDVVRFFHDHLHYPAVAVVENDRPIGLINRRSLMDRYTQPFHKDLYGRRPCTLFMDSSPRLLEQTATISEMMSLLTSEDQRYLTDGLIITDAGRYVGIGTGEQLVRTVTEYRVEAARHANPLTYLPGNIPITEHIEKLLSVQNRFVASYCDLNHFKPFNDQFGYWRGDEMIRLLASVVVAHSANRKDFVGHVGGDDLIVLFQSPDWRKRCEDIILQFNASAKGLFDAAALQNGGIEAEDRAGNPTFFPLTTLSIGAVLINPGEFRRASDVASAAAAAKRQAKRTQQGLFVVEDPSISLRFVSRESDGGEDLHATVWR